LPGAAVRSTFGTFGSSDDGRVDALRVHELVVVVAALRTLARLSLDTATVAVLDSLDPRRARHNKPARRWAGADPRGA
jgi:hypothetical protein